MNTINHKTAFVTGAASGIGLALSKALIAKGANVMMSDIDDDALHKAATEINQPDRVATVKCNVADHESLIASSKATIDRFDTVHLLFNNAGVSLAGKNGSISCRRLALDNRH